MPHCGLRRALLLIAVESLGSLVTLIEGKRGAPWPNLGRSRTFATMHHHSRATVPCTSRLSPVASFDMVVPMNSSLANCT